MRVVYVVAGLIACVVVCANVGMLITGVTDLPRAVGGLVLGSVGAAYCVRQLLRPVPLRNPDPESDDE
jgi:hypothetical protein